MTFVSALKWIAIMIGGILVLLVITAGLDLALHSRVPDVVAGIVLLAAMLGAYILYVRLTERRAVTELAVRPLAPELLLGIVVGALLFAAVIGLLALTGHYQLLGYATVPALAGTIVLTLMGAVAEELLFRGFLYRITQKIAGTWIAVAVSAIAFGALHGFNKGATAFSTIAIAVEAGVLLALAYAVTNRLWLPIGIHFGWNFAEGSIFGVPVSGHQALPSFIRGSVTGSDFITGGAFGVEASIVAVLVCLAASVVLTIFLLRNRRVAPLPSRQYRH